MWKCVSTGRASGRRPPPAAFQRERKHVWPESACFAQSRDGCSAQLLAPRANKVML